ncbi:MAG TPA: hypothetical protein VMZ02_06125 [Candidatus Limnocylindrales bacterium]|nr:hypothetical protein [Candidatus Limnocylindrales bacterium]
MTNVEHQLNAYESRVRNLERRLQLIEAGVGVENASAVAEISVRVY